MTNSSADSKRMRPGTVPSPTPSPKQLGPFVAADPSNPQHRITSGWFAGLTIDNLNQAYNEALTINEVDRRMREHRKAKKAAAGQK